MKKIFVFLSLFAVTIGFSQIHDPVKWSTFVEKISETEYNLLINASIEKNWHLYSQNVPEDGPIPTFFSFETSKDFELIRKTLEEKGHTVDHPVFEMKIKYFENKATFKQRIKVISKKSFDIKGAVEFMVCDDANCLPPTEVDLNFSIPVSNGVNFTANPAEKKENVVESEEIKKMAEKYGKVTEVQISDDIKKLE